ncbi:MAG TPA: GAG-pre-integrase domain-containing protein, partial [Chlamydiales bacterium]|nr:GAG-pre-integrase domain-containing protein [Chlamydiales bacterium]
MAIGKGTIKIQLGKGRKLKLIDTLYVPDATLRLISIGRICDEGYKATFSKTKCQIYRSDGKIIADGMRKAKGLYTLPGLISSMPGERACLARAVPDLKTWHLKLGHVNYDAIKLMAEKEMAKGMAIDLSFRPPECKYCNLGKQTQNPMPKKREGIKASKPLEIIYIGYAERSKAYQCYNPKTGKFYVSRNVQFIESLDKEIHPLKPGLIIGDISRSIDEPDVPHDIPEVPGDILEVPEDNRPIETPPDEQREGGDRTDGGERLAEANKDDTYHPRRSQRVRNLSAAGAAMQGIEITTRTQRAVQQ